MFNLMHLFFSLGPRPPHVLLECVPDHSEQISALKSITEQESSPAWTQKAYRSLGLKFSICCPISGEGGTPSWPDLGGTLSLAKGVPHPWLGEYPIHGWGTPAWTGWGTPRKGPATSHWGTPWKGTWDQSLGNPPGKDLGPVTRVPPPVWTDWHLWKHNLPSYYGR